MGRPRDARVAGVVALLATLAACAGGGTPDHGTSDTPDVAFADPGPGTDDGADAPERDVPADLDPAGPGPGDTPAADDSGAPADDASPGDFPADPAVDLAPEPGADPGTDAAPDPGTDSPGPACTPDGDGTLRADEVPVFLGAAVRYTVRAGDAAPVPDLAGAPCDAGLCWDFAAPVDGDEVQMDVVKPVADWWFGAGFPDDAFVVDLQPGMLAVYRHDASALWMLGMASASDGADRVRLAYDPPVPILKFPLAKGDTYEVETEASGRYDGYDYPMVTMGGTVRVFHTYRFTANGRGRVTVPLGTFDALRLLLDLRMDVRNSLNPTPLATQRFKVYDFLSECVGLVARIRSDEGEVRTFFTEATEYRRLGF